MVLLYNPASKKLVVSDCETKGYQVIMRPFTKNDQDGHKPFTSDITIPESQFRFKILTRYNNSIFGSLRMFNNDVEMFKMSELMHVTPNRQLSTKNAMAEILVSLPSEQTIEWKYVFRIIANTFNNLAVWQANETFIMISELKTLMAETESYEITWNNCSSTPVKYTGANLVLLKAQKLMEAINMLKISEMENLIGIKDDLYTMCVELLPAIKSYYLSELSDITQVKADLDEAERKRDLSEEACKHQKEYIAFMINNKHSSTQENAKARFAKTYPDESTLVDSNCDITNFFHQKNSQWNAICKNRSIIENSMSTIFDFLKENGSLDKFLKAI